MAKRIYTPHLIIGGGLAGLSLALRLSKLSPVLLVSKGPLDQSNTWKAQGGIAAVTHPSDSLENHIQDTLIAGDELCNKNSVIKIISQAPERIKDLMNWGVEFDKNDQELLDLGQEGGHSQRRILHIDDATGKFVHQSLTGQVLAHPQIQVWENTLVTSLNVADGICHGAQALSLDQEVLQINSEATHLATGGMGKTFLFTSNWEGATGDGFHLAHQAGASLCNMEFVQFHPTCLYHPQARNFLISEALRGEGARLKNHKGEYFMSVYDKRLELAPRDIVARAIDHQMKTQGKECVFLDLKSLNKGELESHFTHIFKKCRSLGIEPFEDDIPVVPAAHYQCGGVKVNELGETEIRNLFALGETAYTGLHGANRLASNSLLECLTSSETIYQNFKDKKLVKKKVFPDFQEPPQKPLNDEIFMELNSLWNQTRQIMWNDFSLVRNSLKMQRALKQMGHFKETLDHITKEYQPHKFLLETTSLVHLASLLLETGLARTESRGCHFRTDFPNKWDQALVSVIRKNQLIQFVNIEDEPCSSLL